jgi:hypothetical protein
MSVTSSTHTTYSAYCNNDGLVTNCVQIVQTMYYVNGQLIGNETASTTLSLPAFQSVVESLEPV